MADDFIEKFHNLEGKLLKEKKKSLFLLLDSHKSLESEEHILREINEKLTPKTYLEEIYKLEFLLYFKRTQELFDVLKSGYDIAASKIIRQPWFIKTLFKDFKSEVFVQDVFPQLSVAVRSKILKQILKLYKNEEFIDDLFDCLLENYGTKPAMILLSGCSIYKIKQVLSNNSCKLSIAQLKLLHDKCPSFIEMYYEDWYLHVPYLFYLDEFTSYLSKKDPNLFVKFSLKCSTRCPKLGRRTTKKYVMENKETVLKNAKQYLEMEILNKNALVKQLADDFPKFMKVAVPNKISDLTKSPAYGLLKYYPKYKRYNLYREIVEDVYKMKLFPKKELITKDLLEVIQSDEEREKWVKLLGDKIEYAKFKRSSVAITKLKNQLSIRTDIKSQENLAKDLILNSSISTDFNNAFLEVLKLFSGQLKNIYSSVLFTVLEEIYKKINLNKLTDIHWKYIHNIIQIQNQSVSKICGSMAFEYSRYLYKNNKDFEEIVYWMRKANNNFLETIKFKNANFKDDKFEKKFLELFLRYNSDIDADFHLRKCIILKIRDWNKKHPNDLILVSEKKEMVQSFKDTFSLYNIECLKYLVCRENLSDEFLDLYFNDMNCLRLWKEERSRGCTDRRNKKRKSRHKECIENISMTKWYLKYNPNVFEKKIEKVVECLHINTRYSLMRFLKKYEHTGLVQKIIQYYLEKLKDPEEKKLKNKIAQLLALIMPKNDYLELLQEYVPESYKVLNKTEDEQANLRKIQISLAKSLRYTTCQTEALPILLKYCKGRFLPPALYSMYCCFHRVPEKSLESTIDYLMQKPVTLKKHAVFLTALVFPLKTYKELIQTIDNEDNYSMKKHMFTFKYKYFLKYPNDQLWSDLQTYIDKLTLTEETLLDLLINVNDIPEKYRAVHIEKVYKVLTDLEKNEKPMELYSNKLIQNIRDYNIKLLPRNFCLDVISKNLFNGPDKNLACLIFSVDFLMYADEMKENIQQFLTILCNYKQTYWNSSDSKKARDTINFICSFIFDKVSNKDRLNVPISKEFPTIFKEEWKEVFSIEETFQEYLMLDFLILKYEDNEDSSFYAEELYKMYNNLRKTFGDSILSLFVDFLSKNLENLLGWQEYKIKLMTLFAEMLKIDSSLPNCLLIGQLLPEVYVSCKSDVEFKESYEFVLKTLKNGGEIVQTYLNNHLRKRKFY